MSCFNGYFDDLCSEQRPMSVPCASEAFDGHNDNDLFSEVTAQDNDDNNSVRNILFYYVYWNKFLSFHYHHRSRFLSLS